MAINDFALWFGGLSSIAAQVLFIFLLIWQYDMKDKVFIYSSDYDSMFQRVIDTTWSVFSLIILRRSFLLCSIGCFFQQLIDGSKPWLSFLFLAAKAIFGLVTTILLILLQVWQYDIQADLYIPDDEYDFNYMFNRMINTTWSIISLLLVRRLCNYIYQETGN